MALKTLFEAAGIEVSGESTAVTTSRYAATPISALDDPQAGGITPCVPEPQATQLPVPQHPSPTATDLDPRSDLRDDHRLWVAVLATAWHMPDPDGLRYLHGLLHGLRCGDARLRWEQGRLRLDYKPVLAGSSDLDEAILRRDWLDPRKAQIAECFRRAARFVASWVYQGS